MKVTFISNFLNHHQLPLCRELMEIPSVEFAFVAATPIPAEQLELGYRDMNREPFVIRTYEDEGGARLAETLCLESDVVILGSAPEGYARIRLGADKLLLRYSERIFKDGLIHAFSPRAIRNIWALHSRFRHKQAYLLCAGAYAAADFNRMGAYRGKSYRWGYFPECKEYADPAAVTAAKKENSMLWAGRFLDWKHPELALETAKRLKAEGIPFRLNMIGTGELYPEVARMITQERLDDHVRLLGAMPPEEVRKHMEKSEIFLFTSDFHEGWGAVLNEAMNSCCAVAASHGAGATPVLIENGGNGMIAKSGSGESFYRNVKRLLTDDALRRKLQLAAYQTMVDSWSPKLAARRLVSLSEQLLEHGECDLYETGPCSRAEKLRNSWFKG